MKQKALLQIITLLVMGTILLFPFVVWDGFYSATQLPKLIFLSISVIVLSVLSFLISWKLSRREIFGWLFLFGTLLISFFWNIFFSQDIWISIVGSLERYMWFLTYALTFLFSFLTFSLGKSVITFPFLSRIFIGIWLGLSLIALGQKFWLFGESFIGSMIFEGRAMATIWQYNTFWALLILPLWCIFLSWKTFQSKIFPIFFIALLFAGIWTTGSRIALVGWIGLLITLLISERQRKYFLLWSIFLSIFSVYLLGGYISESWRASLESRKLLLSDAITQIDKFSIPEHLLGRGFESVQSTLLREYSPKYLAYEQIDYIPDRVHNIFLDTYIQFGIFWSIFFFLIFLIYPLFTLWKWETILRRNIWLILLIHFGVLSIGFYDIANLFFATILIWYIYFSSIQKKDHQEISRWSWFLISSVILISSIFIFSILSTDAKEQSLYTEYQNEQDDLLKIIQNDEIIHTISFWMRDDLITKELAKSLGNISEIQNTADELFQKVCDRNSYHILEVCMRYSFLKWDFFLLQWEILRLEPLAPNDIVMLSLTMEIAKHEWNMKKEKELAQKIIALFPSFVSDNTLDISEYQKRKKEKIRNHYPFDEWEMRAK